MRFANMVGNKFFALAFSFLLGQPLKDTLCGTKVLRRAHYEAHRARSMPTSATSIRSATSTCSSARPPGASDRRAAGALSRARVRRDEHPALGPRLAAAAHDGRLRRARSSSSNPSAHLSGGFPSARNVMTLCRFGSNQRPDGISTQVNCGAKMPKPFPDSS